MIKVKKSLSLSVVLFFILSNVAFAESQLSADNPIDLNTVSKETVSNENEKSTKMNSKEKNLMERFMNGEATIDEMRAMTKSKMGNSFSEEQFQKGMKEFKDRASRKDAFSYENRGYQSYDFGPSYEGYSKEQIVFGMVFQKIGDDIDPRDIKQYCNDPNKIADIVISKLKEKVGDAQNMCKQAEENEAKCTEVAKQGCSQIGTAVVREDASELEKIKSIAYSCPVTIDAIKEACKKRNILYMEYRLKNLAETCAERFNFEGERLTRECERFKQYQICDKEKFINRCMAGLKKEDFERKICPAYPVPRCEQGSNLQSKTDVNGCVYYYCVTGTTTQNCKETDSGYDVYAKGMTYVSTVNYGKSDFCADDKTLVEYGCNPDGSYGGDKQYTCEYGCKDGACLRNSGIICPEAPICPAGTTLIYGDSISGGCPGYICNPTTSAIVCAQDVQQCPDGTYVKRVSPSCNFETCPTAPTTSSKPSKITMEGSDGTWCYDSDGNGGYFSKGYCQDTSGTYNDFCDVDTVRDYYCTGSWNGAAWSKVRCEAGGYVCSSGNYKCSDGACVSNPTTTTCPEVSKPTCAEGQSLNAKYDSNKCIVAYYCVSATQTSSQSNNTITANTVYANAVLNTYDDYVKHCENSWLQQEKICSNSPNVCDKSTFIEKCKEQEQKNYADFASRIGQQCETQVISEIRNAQERCNRMDDDRKRCSEQSAKRCDQMKGLAQQCRETLTEENLRNFIIEEAKKRCKFSDIIENKDDIKNAEKAEVVLAVLNTATQDDFDKLKLFVDNLQEDLKLQDTTVYKGTIDPNRFGDIKLLPFVVNAKLSSFESSERSKEVKAKIVAGQKAEDAAGKLVSLRDSDVPNEYLYIIEDKASDVLNVSDNLKEIEKKEEQKGVGYKIRLFLGLAKKAEQEEIKQLQDSKYKLQGSIDALTKLVDEVPSDVAKSILKEQVENLKKQQTDIEALIKAKEKKSKGLFGLFG